jgi:hypothetical protein
MMEKTCLGDEVLKVDDCSLEHPNQFHLAMLLFLPLQTSAVYFMKYNGDKKYVVSGNQVLYFVLFLQVIFRTYR